MSQLIMQNTIPPHIQLLIEQHNFTSGQVDKIKEIAIFESYNDGRGPTESQFRAYQQRVFEATGKDTSSTLKNEDKRLATWRDPLKYLKYKLGSCDLHALSPADLDEDDRNYYLNFINGPADIFEYIHRLHPNSVQSIPSMSIQRIRMKIKIAATVVCV
eukprot:304189_1